MEIKDCTCGGFNENCYKCGGKGFYNEEQSIPKLKHYKHVNKKKKKEVKEQEEKANTLFFECDFCLKMIPENSFVNHYISCKMKKDEAAKMEAKAAKPQKTKSKKRNKAKSPSNRSISTDTYSYKENNDIERRLDASNDFSFLYRENGKYGSSPSYDDYSEEAEP